MKGLFLACLLSALVIFSASLVSADVMSVNAGSTQNQVVIPNDYIEGFLFQSPAESNSTTTTSEITSPLARSVLKITIGMLALAILFLTMSAIGWYVKNNFQTMTSEQYLGISIAILIGLILMIALINFIAGQLGSD